MQIDMNRLMRTETELRQRVECAPSNAEARRDLAWCLILLAMYQAGVEQSTGIQNGSEDAGRAKSNSVGEPQSLSTLRENRSAEQLLAEHLWHAQVLNILPSARRALRALPYELGLGRMIGVPEASSKMSSKYEAALRKFIADIQDPGHESLSNEK